MFITTTRPNDALIEQLLPILEEASEILLKNIRTIQLDMSLIFKKNMMIHL